MCGLLGVVSGCTLGGVVGGILGEVSDWILGGIFGGIVGGISCGRGWGMWVVRGWSNRCDLGWEIGWTVCRSCVDSWRICGEYRVSFGWTLGWILGAGPLVESWVRPRVAQKPRCVQLHFLASLPEMYYKKHLYIATRFIECGIVCNVVLPQFCLKNIMELVFSSAPTRFL